MSDTQWLTLYWHHQTINEYVCQKKSKNTDSYLKLNSYMWHTWIVYIKHYGENKNYKQHRTVALEIKKQKTKYDFSASLRLTGSPLWEGSIY